MKGQPGEKNGANAGISRIVIDLYGTDPARRNYGKDNGKDRGIG